MMEQMRGVMWAAYVKSDPDDFLAFILGVLPLVVSEGSGSEMLQAVGIAVFFGMLGYPCLFFRVK
jgi:threonine/homoserine/homoserine lactone efflux protein